jgi:hypothetical protein
MTHDHDTVVGFDIAVTRIAMWRTWFLHRREAAVSFNIVKIFACGCSRVVQDVHMMEGDTLSLGGINRK